MDTIKVTPTILNPNMTDKEVAEENYRLKMENQRLKYELHELKSHIVGLCCSVAVNDELYKDFGKEKVEEMTREDLIRKIGECILNDEELRKYDVIDEDIFARKMHRVKLYIYRDDSEYIANANYAKNDEADG